MSFTSLLLMPCRNLARGQTWCYTFLVSRRHTYNQHSQWGSMSPIVGWCHQGRESRKANWVPCSPNQYVILEKGFALCGKVNPEVFNLASRSQESLRRWEQLSLALIATKGVSQRFSCILRAESLWTSPEHGQVLLSHVSILSTRHPFGPRVGI